MFRSSLGVVVPPQPAMHQHQLHHHGHHAAASAMFQYSHNNQYAALYQHHPTADDEVFPQFWNEPEHEDGLRPQDEHNFEEDDESEEPVIEQPPSSTNSLFLEPLDHAPRSSGTVSLEMFKDAFLNCNPDLLALSPPPSMTSLEKKQLQQALMSSLSSSSYGRSSAVSSSRVSSGNGALYDAHATPRGPYDQDQLPAVMSLRHHEYNQQPQHQASGNIVMNEILGIQNPPWANGLQYNNNNNNNNSSSLSGLTGFSQQNSMQQLLHSATSSNMAGLSALDHASPLWISTSSLMTPTSQLPAPEFGRKISSKKSKTRRPGKPAAGRRTPMASALALSLASVSAHEDSSRRSRGGSRGGSLSSPAASVHSDSESFSNTESSEKGSKGKKCVELGCVRRAQSNSRCKAHGGGARCQWAQDGGCARSSQGGGFCRAHGGGKRCEFPGCMRGQQRKGRCYVHGGIRKCQMGDCEKKDRGNGYCISHGGGKRCEHPGCSRAVRRGLLCQLHEIAS
ncbi:hypothetical protein Gpo141_00006150 [Globisporangium polare]